MKTYRQFSAEAEFAVENMMLEARGFGGIAKKRRKKKRSKPTSAMAEVKEEGPKGPPKHLKH